jgi:hypothetical protein
VAVALSSFGIREYTIREVCELTGYTRQWLFPQRSSSAKLHLESAAKLILDYNAKISAWDWNANTSVTIADQLENFWEKMRPVREAVCIEMEEEI